MVTLTHGGYMKAQPVADYQAQKRGGRGQASRRHQRRTLSEKLFVANTHNYLLCFSSRGQMYWIKVYNLPQGSRTSRGKPIVNLLPLQEGECINAVLPVSAFSEDSYIFMATANGTSQKDPAFGLRKT